jgi:hypothetical protein
LAQIKTWEKVNLFSFRIYEVQAQDRICNDKEVIIFPMTCSLGKKMKNKIAQRDRQDGETQGMEKNFTAGRQGGSEQ